MSSVRPVTVDLSSAAPLDGANARIRAIANPPGACVLCYHERGQACPPNTTVQLCERHRREMEAHSAQLREGGAHV